MLIQLALTNLLRSYKYVRKMSEKNNNNKKKKKKKKRNSCRMFTVHSLLKVFRLFKKTDRDTIHTKIFSKSSFTFLSTRRRESIHES